MGFVADSIAKEEYIDESVRYLYGVDIDLLEVFVC